jgi:hypothetical protein
MPSALTLLLMVCPEVNDLHLLGLFVCLPLDMVASDMRDTGNA